MFLVLSTAVLLAAPAYPAGAGPAPGIAWRGWDRGLEEARTSGRPVLVDVYTDWCGWCRRMDADVYSRADVRDALARRFVTVKLDAESSAALTYKTKRYSESSLAARFGVSGYPTTIFLKPNGDHLVNVPGYVPADRFVQLLRFVGGGHLERGVSFDDFVRQSGGSAPQK